MRHRSCPSRYFFRWKQQKQEGRNIASETTSHLFVLVVFQPQRLPCLSMLLCRVSAISQTLARWGRGSQRGDGLLHGAASVVSSRCHGISSGEGNARPADLGSAHQGLYRDTVLLPRTDFPTKLAGQKLLDRELEIQQVRETVDNATSSWFHLVC